MQSLIEIAAQQICKQSFTLNSTGSLQSTRLDQLPVECLEQVVAANTVYGLLMPCDQDDNNRYTRPDGWARIKYRYEGFYSSRAKAEERIWFFSPTLDEDQYILWLEDPTDKTRRKIIKKSPAKITQPILSPGYPRNRIHVYFDSCGHATNVPTDYGMDVHHEIFEVDSSLLPQQDEQEKSLYQNQEELIVEEWADSFISGQLQMANGALEDDLEVRIRPEMLRRLAQTYDISMEDAIKRATPKAADPVDPGVGYLEVIIDAQLIEATTGESLEQILAKPSFVMQNLVKRCVHQVREQSNTSYNGDEDDYGYDRRYIAKCAIVYDDQISYFIKWNANHVDQEMEDQFEGLQHPLFEEEGSAILEPEVPEVPSVEERKVVAVVELW
jgi:hypothetical protein